MVGLVDLLCAEHYSVILSLNILTKNREGLSALSNLLIYMRISANIISTAPRLGFVPVEVFGIIRRMKRVYVDGQNFLYKAAEVLIEHGKISSKDELTKIDIRSLVENIVGVGVEIMFYGARVQVRRDLDDSNSGENNAFFGCGATVKKYFEKSKHYFQRSR